jgi:RNA polymerase sigma factor (sigma-70 family)
VISITLLKSCLSRNGLAPGICQFNAQPCDGELRLFMCPGPRSFAPRVTNGDKVARRPPPVAQMASVRVCADGAAVFQLRYVRGRPAHRARTAPGKSATRKRRGPHLVDKSADQVAGHLVGEILLRVHRNLHTLDDHDRLAAWLFRIARNAIIDHYRRAGENREVLEASPGDRLTDDVTDYGDDYSVHRELAACLRPMLDQPSPEHRRALQLTDLDGVTQAGAAALEGITSCPA